MCNTPMATNTQIAKALSELLFRQHEDGFVHTSLREEMRPYELLKQGDPEGVRILMETFADSHNGTLSDDPLRHLQYMFVSAITMICRVAIQAGVDGETAYGLSDLYIRQVDECAAPGEVRALYEKMLLDYFDRMHAAEKRRTYSLHVLKCMDYIDQHIHEQLRLPEVAEAVGVSANYLSSIFSQEMGKGLSDYIRDKKLAACKALLQYSDFTCTEIGMFFGFSSASHFTSAFHARTGLTPLQYREQFKQQMPLEGGSGEVAV